jgi:hypothetical protein
MSDDKQNQATPALAVAPCSAPRLYPATAAKGCDVCRYQEGRHYCLLHSVTLKNMDTIRCHDFCYWPNPEVSHGGSAPLAVTPG